MNELHTYPIHQALDMTQDIPVVFNALLDYRDDEVEMVELGVVDGEVIVRPVFTKDSPTVSSVHVPSTDWQKDKNIIVKAYDDEKRYTLSPWYVPQSVDAHGEWADRDEIQEAFWQYLALDNRDIRLQHNLEIVAGHWVEGCTWPHEVTVPVKHPDGEVEYTFPAGTPFLGVIWEPWAWELIKNGDLRGLSIGGQAERIESDMDENAEYLPMGKVEFAKMISAEGGKFVVYSEDGNREFGTYDTLEQAEERLEQIEYFSNVDKATIEVGDTVGYTIPKPPDRNEIGRGIVTSIEDDGTLTIPNTDESVEGTPDNPAVAVKVYFYDKDEWVESDRSIAKPMSELRIVQDFTKAEISESVKDTLREKVEEHNAKYTAAGKKATLRMLSASYRRGIGAYQGNPSSVRPSVSSAQQWAMGRVNGLLHALRTGKFKRKPYDTDLLPEEHSLSTKKKLEKQDSYEPPKGVQQNAQRALRWIKEGHAGSGFTDVGRRRASQLANGQNVSTRTLARMKSYLSRHQSDKRAVGFHYGEKNFPSPGRVAYDAWGGEEGLRWASSILDRLEKHLPGKHDQSTHARGGMTRRRGNAMKTGQTKKGLQRDAQGRVINPEATGGYGAGIPEEITIKDPDGGNVILTPEHSMWHHMESDGAGGYRVTAERQALHDSIVDKAVADVPVAEDPEFHMLGGGPAAGKSTAIASGVVDVPDKGAAVHVNADDIKADLPEYNRMRFSDDDSDFYNGASFAHEESSFLAKKTMNAGYDNGQSIVLDGTGDGKMSSVESKVNRAKDNGYSVTATYATVPTSVAVERSNARSLNLDERRFVPTSIVTGTHRDVSNVFPQAQSAGLFDKFSVVDTSVRGAAKVLAQGTGTSMTVLDQAGYDSFLAKGNE